MFLENLENIGVVNNKCVKITLVLDFEDEVYKKFHQGVDSEGGSLSDDDTLKLEVRFPGFIRGQ